MKPMNCEVTIINELQSTATVVLDGESPSNTMDVPLARLELANKQVSMLDYLGMPFLSDC